MKTIVLALLLFSQQFEVHKTYYVGTLQPLGYHHTEWFATCMNYKEPDSVDICAVSCAGDVLPDDILGASSWCTICSVNEDIQCPQFMCY